MELLPYITHYKMRQQCDVLILCLKNIKSATLNWCT